MPELTDDSATSNEEGKPLQVYDLFAVIIDQTAAIAWVKLGLQPDPLDRSIATDLPQAKAAIDLVGYLAGALQEQLDEGDGRTIQNLLRDLRLNYISKTGGAA